MKTKILNELDGGIQLVSQTILRGVTANQPRAEEIWGKTKNGYNAHLWYDLNYKRVHANLYIPVSSGCEISEWGKKNEQNGGCLFCAVGRQPFSRYLNAREMLGYVALALSKAKLANSFWSKQEKCLVITFSSAGEPLLNYSEVKKAIARLADAFQKYRIKVYFSIFTVGIVSGINQMISDLDFCREHKIQLRFSLHFPTDEIRKKFMPVRDNIKDVLNAAVTYAEKTSIKLVLHWTLIKDVNDRESDIRTLIGLLKDLKEKRDHVIVRVSRVNPCSYFTPSTRTRRKEIVKILTRAGIKCVPVWRGYAELACRPDHFGG